MVSIVVPILNEEKVLPRLGENLRRLSGPKEVLFVDGHSSDRSAEIASDFGRVLVSARGRARQMNTGAAEASGDILFFLHADCLLPTDALGAIERALCNREVVGGCLTQTYAPHVRTPMFKWIALSGALRARICRTFYGDQGIFCRREVFAAAGGYPEQEIFEDVVFSKRLGRCGLTTVLSTPIVCSPRRWREHGLLRTTLVNYRVQLGWMLNGRAKHLAGLYQSTDVR